MKFVRLAFLISFVLCNLAAAAQVTFVIDELPNTTPLEDTIFISGSFNNWNLKDQRYRLQKRLDGKFSITLAPGNGRMQYKFHRGSWAKVETSSKNDYIPNREFTFGNGKTIAVSIDNWQDVGGAKTFDVFTYYFFSVAFLSIVIIFSLYRLKIKKRSQSKIFLFFLSFVSLILFGRVFFEITSLKWQYYFTLIGEILLFVSGPLWYFIMNPSNVNRRSILLHAIPAIFIFLLMTLKINNVALLDFLTAVAANKLLTWDTVLFFGFGMISNVIYFLFGLRHYEILKYDSDLSVNEQNLIRYHVYSGLIVIMLLSIKMILLLTAQEHVLFWFDRDVIFSGVTIFVIAFGNYVLHFEVPSKVVTTSLKVDDLDSLKSILDAAMKDKKSFRDPHLTLNELSEIVNIKPHVLSRIINECYKQNFRDYVNSYRVAEFIEIAQHDINKRYTFLALANEVGFNSKSTFNAAFKKVTQKSPRDFFRYHKELVY